MPRLTAAPVRMAAIGSHRKAIGAAKSRRRIDPPAASPPAIASGAPPPGSSGNAASSGSEGVSPVVICPRV